MLHMHLHAERVSRNQHRNEKLKRCPATFTRFQNVEFNWKKNCYICGKPYHEMERHDWSRQRQAQ